jgi:hypothetical protein
MPRIIVCNRFGIAPFVDDGRLQNAARGAAVHVLAIVMPTPKLRLDRLASITSHLLASSRELVAASLILLTLAGGCMPFSSLLIAFHHTPANNL